MLSFENVAPGVQQGLWILFSTGLGVQLFSVQPVND